MATLWYECDAFSEIHEQFTNSGIHEASPEEGQPLQQKDKKRRKGKGERKKRKSKVLVQNCDSCAGPKKTVLKPDASDKKGLHVAQMPLSKLQLI